MARRKLTKEFIENDIGGPIDIQINTFLQAQRRRFVDVKYVMTPETEFVCGYSQALLIYEEYNDDDEGEVI